MKNMCGRFTFNGQQWPEFIPLEEQPEVEPNYNISPQEETCVIHLKSGLPEVKLMRWGLRPSWSKKSTMEPINARIETIDSKPMFRNAYRERRCLIPASGWFEWKTTPRGKVPFYHRPLDDSLLLMAGIFESSIDDGETLNSFSIITQEAIGEINHIHVRMPMLVSQQDATMWLNGHLEASEPPEIEVYPVGREVNKTTATGRKLIQPLRTLFD